MLDINIYLLKTKTLYYRRRAEESVDKLRQLLKMLDSQIILDHRGTVVVEKKEMIL